MKQQHPTLQKITKYIKKYTQKTLEIIKVKYISLTIAQQVVLIGSLLGIFSLFVPWITEKGKVVHLWNAFTPISGNIGYILTLIFALLLFLILSNSYKQKVKMYSGIDISNHFLIIISGIIPMLMSVVALSFAVGLGMMGQYMSYGNGPILCLISGILITTGGILIRIDYKKNSSEIILEEMSRKREEKAKKENMELPI